MNIKQYLAIANRDHFKGQAIFEKRHTKYASDDDIFENSKKMAEIARILDIDVRNFPDVEWFYLIGKLVRDRRVKQRENYLDAVNYLRRAYYAEEDK